MVFSRCGNVFLNGGEHLEVAQSRTNRRVLRTLRLTISHLSSGEVSSLKGIFYVGDRMPISNTVHLAAHSAVNQGTSLLPNWSLNSRREHSRLFVDADVLPSRANSTKQLRASNCFTYAHLIHHCLSGGVERGGSYALVEHRE